MLKKTLITGIFSLALTMVAVAQAVPSISNGSFENTNRQEPTGEMQASKIVGWRTQTGPCYGSSGVNSPDLLSTRATATNVGIPRSTDNIAIPNGIPPMPLPLNNNHYVNIRSTDEFITSNFTAPLNLYRRYRIHLWAAVTLKDNSIPFTSAPSSTIAPVLRLVDSLGIQPTNYSSCRRLWLTVPMTTTTPPTQYGQWREYTCDFCVADLMTANRIHPDYDAVLRYVNFRSMFEFGTNGWGLHIDNASIEELPCAANTNFTYSISCNPPGNSLSVTLNSPGNGQWAGSQYNFYTMRANNVQDSYTLSLLGEVTGNSATFTIPNTPGQFIMVKHGVTIPGCDWAEQRVMLTIPAFNDYVNSYFSLNITPLNTTPATFNLSATASASNPENFWTLYSSPNTIPTNTLNPTAGWTPVRGSMTTNSRTYAKSGLQNNLYYMVMQWARHGCSTYGQASQVVLNARYQRSSGKEGNISSTEVSTTMTEKQVAELKNNTELLKK
jgi:hypothetical protein